MDDISELIEDSMTESNVDKKKVIRILSDGLKNKTDESVIYEHLYREIYGDELIPEKCEALIAMLHQGEESGAKWSLADTNGVATRLDINFDTKPYTPEEFRAAMHIEYYHHAVPLKKSGKEMSATDWGRFGDFYFTADSSEKGKLLDFFFLKKRNLKMEK